MKVDKLFPETKCVSVQLADIDTGELLYDKDTKKVFFGCAGQQDGEKFLGRLLECFSNGLRSGRNLSLRLMVYPFVTQSEGDLFQAENDPLSCVQIAI